MTDLAKHIEILLLDNDCVIVPDFGGFMAHYSASVYSENEDLFLPPKRTIGFNPQLVINDSLLAQSYVEAYDISYPEALRWIENDVNELRQHLDNEGFYEFENIGVLSCDDCEKYDFEPCASGLLTPSLYALNSFEMQVLGNANTTFEILDNAQAEEHRNVVPFVKKSEEDNVALAQPQSDEDEEPRVISINVAKLKQFAAAAAVLVFFMLVSIPVGDGTHSNLRLCSLDSGILYRIMPGVEVNGDIPAFLVDKVEEEVVPVDSVETAVAEESAVESKNDVVEAEVKSEYVIVLAACVSKSNADIYVSKLKAEGVSDARVLESGKRKIVCGNYSDENSARAGLNKLQAERGLPDAWVLKMN